MAFKMRSNPMVRNYGAATKQLTEAEKLAARREKRKEEGKPVGLREHLTSAKEGVQKTVKKVVSDVTSVPGDVRKSVETARANNPDVQAGKAKRTARRSARKTFRAALDKWRAGGSKGKRPVIQDFT